MDVSASSWNIPPALIVLENDGIGRGAANGVALAGRHREDVPEAIVALDYQVGSRAGHA